MASRGKVRVGRIIQGKQPSFENFTPIVVMTKSSKYGSLSPYELRDENGRIMENIWQFSKLYKNVPKSKQIYSRYQPFTIWEHPEENHLDSDNHITKNYWQWRRKGMNNKYAVRYPVGYHYRHQCMFSILCKTPDPDPTPEEVSQSSYKCLDYVQSRKYIYVPLYLKLVQEQDQFKELKKRLANGENLLILEVDGPHQESVDYYKSAYYDIPENFIEQNTIEANPFSLSIMLHDEKHPFGHGYCLSMALQNLSISSIPEVE